jgi:hypothetical protein
MVITTKKYFLLRDDRHFDYFQRTSIAIALLENAPHTDNITAVIAMLRDETVYDNKRSALARSLFTTVGADRLIFETLRGVRDDPERGKAVRHALAEMLLRYSASTGDAQIARALSQDITLDTSTRTGLLWALVDTLEQPGDVARMRNFCKDPSGDWVYRVLHAENLIRKFGSEEDAAIARGLCEADEGKQNSFDEKRREELALSLLTHSGVQADRDLARKMLQDDSEATHRAEKPRLALCLAQKYGAPEDIERLHTYRNHVRDNNDEFMKTNLFLFKNHSVAKNQKWLEDWNARNPNSFQSIVLNEALDCLKKVMGNQVDTPSP